MCVLKSMQPRHSSKCKWSLDLVTHLIVNCISCVVYLYVFVPCIPNVFVSCKHVFQLWQGMSYDVDPCDISNVIQVKVAITPQSPSNQKYLEFEHFVSTEYLNLSVEGNRIWHQRILLQNNNCIFQYIICTF